MPISGILLLILLIQSLPPQKHNYQHQARAAAGPAHSTGSNR